MRIGFGAPVAGAWATPGFLGAFAERAEDTGYASLWTFQRLLVPGGSNMAPVYHSVLDPMVALGYAAARTARIRLGVAVINMPFVSSAYLAKQATTVDVLSGSFGQIRSDTEWLAGQGVTEVFYDLNWDPQVGNPAVEPEAAAERATEILAALAP